MNTQKTLNDQHAIVNQHKLTQSNGNAISMLLQLIDDVQDVNVCLSNTMTTNTVESMAMCREKEILKNKRYYTSYSKKYVYDMRQFIKHIRNRRKWKRLKKRRRKLRSLIRYHGISPTI
ncbi:MAG: hypothetical protein LBR22_05700 [Desulfovibrio sp.]|jgi:uncharacterized protein YwgA|nr:hypothetical protein [Desulfovibrio sp.]